MNLNLEAWEEKKLSELIYLSNGKGLTKKNFSDDGVFSVYGANGVIGRSDEAYIKHKTISIGRVGSCGAVNIILPPAWITDNAMYVSNIHESLNFDFLYFLLQNINLSEKRKQGVMPSLSQKEILDCKVKVPPLEEQEYIVTRIQDCLGRLEEIGILNKDNIDAIYSVKRSLVLGERRSDRDWVEVGELVDWIKDTESVSETETYHFVGTKSFGKGLFHSATRTAQDFKYPSLRRLRHRDFIYAKLMAWEGAFGMVPKEFDGFVVSPEFVVFRTKDGIICPEVLDTYFRSPICLEDVRNASTGSNKRRRRINPQAFLKLKMPVPPHDVQEQLKKVYEFEAKAAESWKDLPETLEKIRQGILRKAFAGEL
ncbi:MULTISPECIES: restriction endonuclease subunit S [Calothrix]|uniref:Restriction endonuclease subunit S n=2 Tax=Calothrix TaxID=1186 RepID=A0ABR8A2V4_9CYAN|nr:MULTISPECIES: restriction endonuclease subunit S [Calothrix]MBD2194189.1 restriction endonuclease subunit S [Calothrix parietina FACHB-288]MBD2224985.1 restriction endonuclease subunit S [Calothrix anomala FACHB-343]